MEHIRISRSIDGVLDLARQLGSVWSMERNADAPLQPVLDQPTSCDRQIVHAHAGELTVTSSPQEIRFIFTMPRF